MKHYFILYTCVHLSIRCYSVRDRRYKRQLLTISKEPKAAAQFRSVCPTSSMKFTSNPGRQWGAEMPTQVQRSVTHQHSYSTNLLNVRILATEKSWQTLGNTLLYLIWCTQSNCNGFTGNFSPFNLYSRNLAEAHTVCMWIVSLVRVSYHFP